VTNVTEEGRKQKAEGRRRDNRDRVTIVTERVKIPFPHRGKGVSRRLTEKVI
jgi:predicted GNAT family acetyltransferase